MQSILNKVFPDNDTNTTPRYVMCPTEYNEKDDTYVVVCWVRRLPKQSKRNYNDNRFNSIRAAHTFDNLNPCTNQSKY